MSIPKPIAIHHTSFLVHDLEAAVDSLARSLGVGPWTFFTIRPTASRVRGREQAFSFRVALATIGGGTFELVSPLTGPSVYDEFLARHGDGFHHTCLVYPTIEDVRAAKLALLAEGREVIQEGSGGEVFEFAYFDFPEIGSAVEPRRAPPSPVMSR